jgi:alginate O-acetyltransferase complex protein AlgI
LTSQAFFVLALPCSLILYYWLFRTPRAKTWFLCISSLVLYALGGWQYLLILVGLSLATYWMALWKRPMLGIVLNLLALILFKYWNFGAGTLNGMLEAIRGTSILPYLSIGLPLGISFYVFKHIGYLLETRQAHYPPCRDFTTFLTYSAFFPQIPAGPISDFQHTSSQFPNLPDGLSPAAAYEGILRISMGLAKKILIANTISTGLASQNLLDLHGSLPAWFMVIAYACELYFDFSGYSDIALGVARFFGVNFPINFNNPYLAITASQFWERWHISLSSWFRYYLFSPISRILLKKNLIGNKDAIQVQANLLTMALIGLWHGAAWTFILWGGYHGVLLSLDGLLRRYGRIKFPLLIRRAFLLFAVLVGWAIFMSPDLGSMSHLLGQMFGFGGIGSVEDLRSLGQGPLAISVLAGIVTAFSGIAESSDVHNRFPGSNRWAPVAWGVLAALAILRMGTHIDFLYMQF